MKRRTVKQQRAMQHEEQGAGSATSLAELPDDLLLKHVAARLGAAELCALGAASRRLRKLTGSEECWRSLFSRRWRPPAALLERAARLAGSWKALYADKAASDRAAAPWATPCEAELAASLDLMLDAKRRNPSAELACMVLVDGSGSVSDEDFATMRAFIGRAAAAFGAADPACRFGILQFSNDVRIEQPLAALAAQPGRIDTVLSNMVRMNGGTNIATALQRAGALFKSELPAAASRCLVLLTDGRIDSYQSREALAIVERLADEQAHTQLFAYGVGRGVDKGELIRIVGGAGKEGAAERYLDLRTREDTPW